LFGQAAVCYQAEGVAEEKAVRDPAINVVGIAGEAKDSRTVAV
jgi:hypothetical protein